MCLATPVKILSRNGSWCKIEGAGHVHRVNIDLVPKAKTFINYFVFYQKVLS